MILVACGALCPLCLLKVHIQKINLYDQNIPAHKHPRIQICFSTFFFFPYAAMHATLSLPSFHIISSSEYLNAGSYRHLPALGECLATLVGAMPVAFLEPPLNAHNPLSVFNTKTPRERASECPPVDLLTSLYLTLSDWCLSAPSPEHARHSGGDVSRDASSRQTAQRRQ